MAAVACLAAFVPLSGMGVNTWGGDPFGGKRLFVNPNSVAARAARSLDHTDPAAAAVARQLAAVPTAIWLTGPDAAATVTSAMRASEASGSYPVFVLYAIPDRDCGGASGGGFPDAATYLAWIATITGALGHGAAAVIVEPDALAMSYCLSATQQQKRLGLLRAAVNELTTTSSAVVYLDAGHSGWRSAADMASLLRSAGIADARGFSVNVANFSPTSTEAAYADHISRLVGGKHYVIDTSRNGRGPTSQWCNPPGQRVGQRPEGTPGHGYQDAALWIKTPGVSDGPCNGGPPAGQWFPSYTQELLAG
jgi:endoglucanase